VKSDTQHVRRRSMELPVQLVERTGRCLSSQRRIHRLAADHALRVKIAFQPIHRAAGVFIIVVSSSQELGPSANLGRCGCELS